MITLDHANRSFTAVCPGRELLRLTDFATGYIGAYLVGSKTSERVLMALTHFLGHDQPRDLYADRALELIAAVRGFPGGPNPHRMSIPGLPQTNGLATSEAKQLIRGDTNVVATSGLSARLVAICAQAFRGEAHIRHGRPSPLSVTDTGNSFSGPLIPFGALVHATPSALHKGRNLKSEATLKPAFFLGYVVQYHGK